MSSLKILAAAVAAATVSFAMAQGTPPRPASNPAIGAGQQSTQGTPMGTTGTPGGSGMSTGAQGSTAGSSAAATAGTSGSMNATTTGDSTMAADTHTTKKHHKSRKTAKADRN